MPPLDITSTLPLCSGHAIPILGLGVFQTPASLTTDVVTHAVRAGYRHVDSATMYGNEGAAATGLKAARDAAGKPLPRDALFFTSKVLPQDMSYKRARASVDETLRKTGLGYVDLYLLHAPYGGRAGRLGAWKALAEAVREGKVRSIGVSNYGVHHLEELEEYIKDVEAREGEGKAGVLSVNQVELHPWLARPDIVSWCKERGVVLEAYSPLVRAQRMRDPRLVSLGKKHNKTPAQILIRWSMQMGFVTLPKSVKRSRIEENSKVYDFELTPEDMKTLETGEYSPCSWDPTKGKD